MTEKKRYVYRLSNKLEYSKDGEFKTTAELEFIGPNMSVLDQATDLSQKITQAFMDLSKFKDILSGIVETPEIEKGKKPKIADDALEIDSIKMILMQSKKIRFADIASICKEMFPHVGTYDGTTKITKSGLNRLEIEDFIGAVCGYIANFIIPSLF